MAARSKERYGRTAANMRKWVRMNPGASLKRRVQAFNAIADSEHDEERKQKIEKVSKRLVKRI